MSGIRCCQHRGRAVNLETSLAFQAALDGLLLRRGVLRAVVADRQIGIPYAHRMGEVSPQRRREMAKELGQAQAQSYGQISKALAEGLREDEKAVAAAEARRRGGKAA